MPKGRFKRNNTGQWEFDAARAVEAACESAVSWMASIQRAAPEPEEPERMRITVEVATEAFLAKCKSRNIAPNTLAKHRTFTNQ